jgi:GNAT superfamily N-acetyltransferase
MGTPFDEPAIARLSRDWLRASMPAGTYRAWVVEDEARTIVAGGGMTLIPWPPGPSPLLGQVAFVYNVYTEPAHRRRGLARLVMTAIHDWCGDAGVAAIALNASRDGRQLYDSLGYVVAASPMMWRVKV